MKIFHTKIKAARQAGYTLIEIMVVIILISAIAAIAYTRLYNSSAEIGGAERVLAEAATRVLERRSEAARLNGENRQMAVYDNVPPLPIDFASLPDTASLITEGDDNDDCADDLTGGAVTCLVENFGVAQWETAFRADQIILPTNWTVAANVSSLGGIPLIAAGSDGRGILVTKVGFNADGRAFGFEPSLGAWVGMPSGAAVKPTPSLEDAPFWAIYFVGRNPSGGVIAAAVVAVHPSGLVERFHFDGTAWVGFQNRTL
jgi:prepilin-type N-terminal cleavage/methylation domain-containing protein